MFLGMKARWHEWCDLCPLWVCLTSLLFRYLTATVPGTTTKSDWLSKGSVSWPIFNAWSLVRSLSVKRFARNFLEQQSLMICFLLELWMLSSGKLERVACWHSLLMSCLAVPPPFIYVSKDVSILKYSTSNWNIGWTFPMPSPVGASFGN